VKHSEFGSPEVKVGEQRVLSIDQGLQATYASASAKLHAAVRVALRDAEMKQGDDFAASVGMSPSHLSEALSGRGAKHFGLHLLPRVLHIDKARRFLSTAADLVACVVVPRQALTAAQKLELLKAELRDAGADVDALEARAYLRSPPWESEAEGGHR
jgi:hypothetical protein